MSETTMPAAEAEGVVESEELSSYELAFHVLPTVAEGEVPAVFEAIKGMISAANGEIFDEEAPERFDLAYEIVKPIEGKNRKFASAYFGWVRFKAVPSAIEELGHSVEEHAEILRHLLIKLTKAEEESPIRFHDALSSEKKVTDVDAEKPTPAAAVEEKTEDAEEETKTETEETPDAETEKVSAEKEA